MPELLPCPFCGGYADLDYYHNENDDGGGRGKVICSACGVEAVGDDKGWMSNEADMRTSKSEAVAMWNRRAVPSDIDALRKRVEAADAMAELFDAAMDDLTTHGGYSYEDDFKKEAATLAAYRATGAA
jgi:Lar family restriction alleviation protein